MWDWLKYYKRKQLAFNVLKKIKSKSKWVPILTQEAGERKSEETIKMTAEINKMEEVLEIKPKIDSKY